MSDIRFNQWLHNSGTGGVSQVDGGHVGIGTTNPLIPVGSGNTAILNVGVVTANSFYGDGSNLSGLVGGGTSLSFNDNIGAYFGNSQDLKIYHDGNHSYIDDQGTGNLRLRSGTLEILNLAGNKTSATFSSGGGQTLNFNNSAKFVTTNTGAVVTGIVTATSRVSLGNNTTNAVDIEFGTNRGSAGDTLANINWKWNNTYVAQIRGMAGSDTTNKDDAHLNFYTASAGSLVERLRITSGGNVRHFGGDNRMYTFSSDDTAHYMKFNNTLNGIILNGYGGIAFETNGANERVRITATGQTKLNIASNGALTEPLVIRNGGTGQNTNVGMVFYNGNESSTGAGALARIKALDVGGYDSDLVFETGLKSGWSNTTTERLRITSDGKVKIGNSGGTPDGKLHIDEIGNGDIVAELTANSPMFTYRNGSGSWFHAGKHPSDDAYVVTTGGTTTTSEKFRIDGNGYVTKPLHPAFFVTMNGGDQTTAAANIMPFDTVVHNNGGHYKTSGPNIYHFVCPVAGYYFFGGQVWLKHGSGNGNHARWEIWRDTTIVALAGWHQNGVNLNDHQSAATVTIYCDAGAKVYMEADYALTYWRGNAGNPHTFFHGHFIG